VIVESLRFARLVAVTLTIVVVATFEGAVYSPVALIWPTSGLMDHFTAWFVDPLTLAVNWTLPEGATVLPS